MTEHVDLSRNYVLTGHDIAAMLGIAYRLNDGNRLSSDERRDLAQKLKAILDKREEFDP